jgi:beta-fructofuranosidase
MWAWLVTLDDAIAQRSIQSLPRELSLGSDGRLRINPLRELASLRYDGVVLEDVTIDPADHSESARTGPSIAELDGDAFEVRITIDRAEARRKRFGVQLFADEDHDGLPIMILPERGALLVGTTEAPFSVNHLAAGEDLVLTIFIDKYLVELFANDRQAVVAAYMDDRSAKHMRGYAFHRPTHFRKVEIWRLKPTNQGFFEARESRIWQVDMI